MIHVKSGPISMIARSSAIIDNPRGAGLFLRSMTAKYINIELMEKMKNDHKNT